mmetsp:Transcript_26911/g.56370  ORF Transcript_26911/g.56370 Transcript_26911/m.56370 type:complete len:92 (+) Transcript_26911:133-408(+)
MNKANSINAPYSWVKGHLDDNTDKEELPLLAQLNIEADNKLVAGQFQQDYGQYFPVVPVFPASPAMLAIRGISITSQYNTTYRERTPNLAT